MAKQKKYRWVLRHISSKVLKMIKNQLLGFYMIMRKVFGKESSWAFRARHQTQTPLRLTGLLVRLSLLASFHGFGFNRPLTLSVVLSNHCVKVIQFTIKCSVNNTQIIEKIIFSMWNKIFPLQAYSKNRKWLKVF